MTQAQPIVEVPSVQQGTWPLRQELSQLRREVVQALHGAGSGHFGGCLSVIDLLLTLYRRQLRVCPFEPRHPDRDRLILSKGHASMALYAVLRNLGYIATPLARYGQFGGRLEGHPDMQTTPGVDFSTGSLGQGLSVGAGMALGLRGASGPSAERHGVRQHVWVVLGDGECQEGQVWEAALFAAHHGLAGLHAVVDANGFQEWGWTTPAGEAAPPVVDAKAKWSAFGWRVFECDGHDPEELSHCYTQMADERSRPSVLIAHTKKGHGVPLIERDPMRSHCDALAEAEFQEIEEGFRAAC